MQVQQLPSTTPVTPPAKTQAKPPRKEKGHGHSHEVPIQSKRPYNADAFQLSTNRREEMKMVTLATGVPLNFKSAKQEESYLKSLEMALPVEKYDPKGFLKSLGLWGIEGSGRDDAAFVHAVKDTDYKPHFNAGKVAVPIPGFIMKGMIDGSPTYTAVQGFVDPALAAYTNKRGMWKKPLTPGQTPKPTDVTPQTRYAQAFGGVAPKPEWGNDFHNGEKEGENGYGTFQIAKALGFTEDQARRMGGTSYGVDLNTTPYGKTGPIVIGQMDRHFNFDRNGEDTRIRWARRHLELAIEYGRKGAYDEAEIELGVGLHSLQDLFAHGQVSPSVHATLGKFVDDPLWSPVSMVESTVATRNYMKAYLKGITSSDGSYALPPEPQKPSAN